MQGGAYKLAIVRPDGTAIDLPHNLDRVTTVLKAVFAKEGLVYWAYDIGAHGVAELARQGYDVAAMDDVMLQATLKEYGASPWAVRDARAEEGTDAHDYLEKIADGRVIVEHQEDGSVVEWEPPEEFPPVYSTPTGYKLAVARWWLDTLPDVVASEQTLVSVTDRYAGTTDLIHRVPCPDHEGEMILKITDLKTKGGPRPLTPKKQQPKKLNPYDEHHGQLGAYARAYHEMTGQEILAGSILFAFEDGVYAEVDCQPDERLFLAALQMYRALEARKGNR